MEVLCGLAITWEIYPAVLTKDNTFIPKYPQKTTLFPLSTHKKTQLIFLKFPPKDFLKRESLTG